MALEQIVKEGMFDSDIRTAIMRMLTELYAGTWRAVTAAAKIGYGTGAGGAVTQATSKSTGVTLNTPTGQITTHGAALAAATEVSFTVTNSKVEANDIPVVAIKSGNTAGAYTVTVDAVAAGSFQVTLGNVSAGSLSETLVLNFGLIRGSAS